MAKLDRNGVKIHYEVHGSGPTILLSHGYSSTSRMWDGQVAALKDRYRVIVWDFRGHGESDYPSDQSQYSEALTVGDMKALLDHVGAKAIVFFLGAIGPDNAIGLGQLGNFGDPFFQAFVLDVGRCVQRCGHGGVSLSY